MNPAADEGAEGRSERADLPPRGRQQPTCRWNGGATFQVPTKRWILEPSAGVEDFRPLPCASARYRSGTRGSLRDSLSCSLIRRAALPTSTTAPVPWFLASIPSAVFLNVSHLRNAWLCSPSGTFRERNVFTTCSTRKFAPRAAIDGSHDFIIFLMSALPASSLPALSARLAPSPYQTSINALASLS